MTTTQAATRCSKSSDRQREESSACDGAAGRCPTVTDPRPETMPPGRAEFMMRAQAVSSRAASGYHVRTPSKAQCCRLLVGRCPDCHSPKCGSHIGFLVRSPPRRAGWPLRLCWRPQGCQPSFWVSQRIEGFDRAAAAAKPLTRVPSLTHFPELHPRDVISW